MLTQEQLKNLEPFTKHPKYGKLVKDAIIGWKRCKPISDWFGLDFNNCKNKFVRNKSYSKGCCLLGASVLNRKTEYENPIIKVSKKYNMPSSDAWEIVYGFDNLHWVTNKTEAFQFGNQVRKALGL